MNADTFLSFALAGVLFAGAAAPAQAAPEKSAASAAKPAHGDPSSLESLLSNERVCRVSRFNETTGCTVGGLVLYLPERWDNPRLPLQFVAAKCRTDKSVVMNDAGVVCTYAGERAYGIYDGADASAQRTAELGEYNASLWAKISSDKHWIENGDGRLTITKAVKLAPILPGDRFVFSVTKIDPIGRPMTKTPDDQRILNAFEPFVGLGVGTTFEYFRPNPDDMTHSEHFQAEITEILRGEEGRSL